MFRPLHHFLRILLLSALFSLRAFFLNHSKRLCHVFDLIPNIEAYIDRYVWGLADVLEKPLAIYFSPTDYLRITPSWLIPTLGVSVSVSLVAGLVFSIVVFLSAVQGWRSARQELPRMLPRPPPPYPARVIAKNAGFLIRLLIGPAILWLLYVGMGLAKRTGERYARFQIQQAPLTRVFFESEKDQVAAVEGKVIFDLERYLLLLAESKSVVAIPHEKIKWIQTPPLPVEKKPTPAGASPTPAETSPTPTGTPHVSPSPIESPPTTAEPRKK